MGASPTPHRPPLLTEVEEQSHTEKVLSAARLPRRLSIGPIVALRWSRRRPLCLSHAHSLQLRPTIFVFPPFCARRASASLAANSGSSSSATSSVSDAVCTSRRPSAADGDHPMDAYELPQRSLMDAWSVACTARDIKPNQLRERERARLHSTDEANTV